MLYPLFMNLAGKKCLVVGGGRVALRKVIALLRSKASVNVVSIDFCNKFSLLDSLISRIKRPFLEADIYQGLSLVIGATDNPEVNKTIFDRCEQFGILCNIVDQPKLCSFYVPAVIRRGDITIALSTGGAAPMLAKYLKVLAGRAIGPELAPLASLLAEMRLRLMTSVKQASLRLRFWEELFSKDPIQEISEYGLEGFRHKVNKHLETILTIAEKHEQS